MDWWFFESPRELEFMFWKSGGSGRKRLLTRLPMEVFFIYRSFLAGNESFLIPVHNYGGYHAFNIEDESVECNLEIHVSVTGEPRWH